MAEREALGIPIIEREIREFGGERMTQSLLLEIGLEELPAQYVPNKL